MGNGTSSEGTAGCCSCDGEVVVYSRNVRSRHTRGGDALEPTDNGARRPGGGPNMTGGSAHLRFQRSGIVMGGADPLMQSLVPVHPPLSSSLPASQTQHSTRQRSRQREDDDGLEFDEYWPSRSGLINNASSSSNAVTLSAEGAAARATPHSVDTNSEVASSMPHVQPVSSSIYGKASSPNPLRSGSRRHSSCSGGGATNTSVTDPATSFSVSHLTLLSDPNHHHVHRAAPSPPQQGVPHLEDPSRRRLSSDQRSIVARRVPLTLGDFGLPLVAVNPVHLPREGGGAAEEFDTDGDHSAAAAEEPERGMKFEAPAETSVAEIGDGLLRPLPDATSGTPQRPSGELGGSLSNASSMRRFQHATDSLGLYNSDEEGGHVGRLGEADHRDPANVSATATLDESFEDVLTASAGGRAVDSTYDVLYRNAAAQ